MYTTITSSARIASRLCTLLICLSISSLVTELSAQEDKPTIRTDAIPEYTRHPSLVKVKYDAIRHIPALSRQELNLNPIHRSGKKHYGNDFRHRLDSVKQSKLALMRVHKSRTTNTKETNKMSTISPQINRNFEGNTFNGWYPPDNAIAIADDGMIVSLVNSTIEFSDANGIIYLSQDLDVYFSYLNIPNAGYFDPRVLYDPLEDKFIIVCLTGFSSTTSKLIVSFSSTSDPRDTWYTYVFDGNEGNVNAWFDFPHIGVSTNDLFITGNLFSNSDIFQEVILYQLDKSDGFQGISLTYAYWTDILGGDNTQTFTVKPVSYGYNGGYGPGVFLIASRYINGNSIQLFDVSEDLGNSPTLTAYAVPCTSYDIGGDALQQNSNKLLDVGDCRMHSAIYAYGYIHYVHHNEYINGYNGLRYGKLDVSNLSIQTRTYGLDGYSYAYPAIATFDQTASTTPDLVIAFTRSASNIYPEARVTAVDGNLDFSGSLQAKNGETAIEVSTNTVQRWGDYSGVSKQHGTTYPTVWMFGCYGKQNIYGNWIAEIVPSGTPTAPNDVCQDAIPLSCNIIIEGATTYANTTQLENCGTPLNQAPGVWYALSNVSGEVIASLCDNYTNYDTKLAVYAGACDDLYCVGANDDSSCNIDDLFSEVTFDAHQAETYYIYVTGYSNNYGDFALSLTCTCSDYAYIDGQIQDHTTIITSGTVEIENAEVISPFELLLNTPVLDINSILVNHGASLTMYSEDGCNTPQ